MKNQLSLPLIFIFFILTAASCSKQSDNAPFIRLLPESCEPLATAALKPVLDDKWQPYLSATRVCPLSKSKNINPKIFLIAIFVQDYYLSKPENALWEEFPTPILVNNKGKKVGEMPALFPEVTRRSRRVPADYGPLGLIRPTMAASCRGRYVRPYRRSWR